MLTLAERALAGSAIANGEPNPREYIAANTTRHPDPIPDLGFVRVVWIEWNDFLARLREHAASLD